MAATGRFYQMDFREGKVLTTQQKFALGQQGLDNRGGVWSYVEFTEDLKSGQWVMDGVESVASGGITHGGVKQNHTSFKATAGTFSTAFVQVGAYGMVVAGGAEGDSFAITGLREDNTIIDVAVFANDATDTQVTAGTHHRGRTDNTGWSADFTGATALQLYYPGRAGEGDAGAGTARARGVVQVEVDMSAYDKTTGGVFGWVLQEGVGLCRIGTAGTLANRFLTLAADGEFNRSATAAGVATALVTRGAANELTLAEIRIENNASRWTFPPQRAVGAAGHSGSTGVLV